MADTNTATRLSEALYRDIVENCADAIVVIDADQKIAYANHSAERMFGRPHDGLVGKPLGILIPERYRARHGVLARSFSSSNDRARLMDSREAPIYGLRADGTEFPASASILKSGSGADLSTVAIIRDITEQKALEADLRRMANTDALTALLNRRAFLARAEQEFARATRYGRPMALAMIDIDRFKAINDRYGHAVGDQAIRHITDTVSSGLRKPDVFGRWGGEEFALLLPETEEKPALTTAQRLRRSVETAAFSPAMPHETSIHITVSMGVAGVEPNDARVDDVVNRADQALYAAKRKGRNRVCAIGDLAKDNSNAA